MSTFLTGTTVKFTTNNLGLIGRGEVVNAGDLGRVLGPGPDEGWLYIEPAKFPGSVCPVVPEMIEAVS